ncbi:hypothetical protein OpiT1DRAFT_00120 [Opitutaceae bacterium TAV1]|nr:hypothetical protein OpiT1DRAFT_00120 [Opitutaceae bacterium TAV1]
MMRPDIQHILFIGDSITSHQPAPALGWHADWGMAATTREHDYVHQLARLVSIHQGHIPAFTVFGKGGGTLVGKLAESATLAHAATLADIIVVQMGENDKPATADAFQHPYASLLNLLHDANPAARIYCTGVWSPPCGSPGKDAFIRETCIRQGHTFVDITTANTHPRARTGATRRWDHPGVAWHPSDEGMEAYATALFSAITDSASLSNPAPPVDPLATTRPSILYREKSDTGNSLSLIRTLPAEKFTGKKIELRARLSLPPSTVPDPANQPKLILDIHNAEGEHEVLSTTLVPPPPSLHSADLVLTTTVPDNAVELIITIFLSPQPTASRLPAPCALQALTITALP